MLQALFEVDLVGHDPHAALTGRLQEIKLPEVGVRFCWELLRGVLDHRDALDAIVQEIAPEWPISQIAPIDRNILRLAAYEILYGVGTPPKVAINEAVEMAKIFGSDSSSRFVNGVLGTLLAQSQALLERLQMETSSTWPERERPHASSRS